MKGPWIVVLGVLLGGSSAPTLSVTLVGNAGVVMSDGDTSLLIDLPYESGAFGYETYDWQALTPSGETVSVVTHHHRDHFDPELFEQRSAWRLFGPPSVSGTTPRHRVIAGDSVRVGAFSMVAIATPHTEDHRSYRVRWRGRVFHFSGDTEDSSHLRASPPLDVLFVTPWLSCAAAHEGRLGVATRSVAYHRSPAGDDEICGGVDTLPQGTTLTFGPAEE